MFFIHPQEKNGVGFTTSFDKRMKIIIAPGNHDIGYGDNLKIFKESVNQNTDFPIILNEKKVYIFLKIVLKVDGIFRKKTFDEIKKINQNKQIILLRHNIASRELTPLANSDAFRENLSYSKDIDILLNRNITIISGDGGAFKKLPRIFCRTYGKIKYIINGLGGIEGDSVLVIHDNKIFNYVLK